MILLIDNYDSFSYNLVQMAGGIRPDIKVIRNDAMTVEEIRELGPDHIILSPGPGYPKDAGICFFFAPVYHSSMKYAAPVRKELGVRTVFNILGPLSNLAAATMQLLGVYDEKLAGPLAKVLSNLGVTRGVAVCGADGLDEITLTGATKVYEIRDGKITSYSITPEQFGLKSCPLEELIGGTPEENAQITLNILTGKETGAKRDVVLMNAGMSLYLGIAGITLEEGIQKAKELIEAGARVIGVNNRNLKDFTVDIGNSLRLRSQAPEEILFVAESGIKTAEDIRKLKEAKVNGVLIGETLMRSPDKKACLKELDA